MKHLALLLLAALPAALPAAALAGQFPALQYATQVGVQPPTIVLLCNEPRGFSEQYRRFLLRVLRDNLKFGEVPIKMYLQKRRRDDKRNDVGAEEDSAAEAAAMAEEFGPDEEQEVEMDEVGEEE